MFTDQNGLRLRYTFDESIITYSILVDLFAEDADLQWKWILFMILHEPYPSLSKKSPIALYYYQSKHLCWLFSSGK